MWGGFGGDCPLKPYPAQRFQGMQRGAFNVIDQHSLTRVPQLGYFYALAEQPQCCISAFP